MSIKFVDRVSAYPNRYLVTPENGTPYYVTLERADEPTTVGTPLNAATLNQFVALADIQNLPNMHLWKKYVGDPSLYTETEVADHTLSSKLKGASLGNYSEVTYGDSYTYANGVITLNNQKTTTPSTASSLQTTLRGKYVQGATENGSLTCIYYIPEDATISRVEAKSGYLTFYRLNVDTATRIDANYLKGYVMDESSSTYPTEGTNEDDGYWYVYHKRFGD